MSLLMKLIGLNVPLWQWEAHENADRAKKEPSNNKKNGKGKKPKEKVIIEKSDSAFVASSANYVGFSVHGKKDDVVAQVIFNSMSNDRAHPLIVREYHGLAPQIRMALRELCNGGNATGNVRKGVQRVNELLGGALLREVQHTRTFATRVTDRFGNVVHQHQRVDPSVAGAAKKYGIIPRTR